MKKEIIDSIEEARSEVIEAKRTLETVLNELRVASRAEKTTITLVLEKALAQLAHASDTLTKLELSARREKE